jgi:hypothetical protein
VVASAESSGWRGRISSHLRVKRIGDLLVRAGVLGEADLARALQHQREHGGRLGEILIDLGLVRSREIYAALVRQWATRAAVTLLTATLLLPGVPFRRGELVAPAEAASATAMASATVLPPLSVDKVADLSFGAFSATAAGGTITVTPDGGQSGENVQRVGGTPAAARFTISGIGNRAFQVSLPAAGSIILSSRESQLAIENFSLEAPSALSDGTADIKVGGTLKVGANQPPGTYVGRFTLIVEYE